jgi:hypothetical protein
MIFRRPDLTARVFESIRQAQPVKLLVIADGPRNAVEAVLCQQARAITETIDWDCEVIRNYADVNLGCRNRVSSGLNWAFEQVEEAIILEDDCFPAPSFFQFCQTLLEKYRHDERIVVISGNNFQDVTHQKPNSYYFSKYNHIWGWASWRRAWKHYDLEMKTWPMFKDLNLIESICHNPFEQQYWLYFFQKAYEGEVDTWDYQWTYACWSQGGITVLPSTNLVSNIGFCSDATHTTNDSPLANMLVTDIWEINFPPFMLKDQTADQYTFDHVFGGIEIQSSKTISAKLGKLMKKPMTIFKETFLRLALHFRA